MSVSTRIILFFSVFLLSFPNSHVRLRSPQALAAPQIGSTGVPAASLPQDKVGVAAAVRGIVELTRTGQVGHVVESGAPIYLGDSIITDAKGHLQLLLMDGTVFTIGPSSELIIDKFVFDAESHDGQVHARAVKGVFRFVTGKIARKKPENVRIDVPAGFIGIRGTIVTFQVIETATTAVLMGPGEKNNAGMDPGGMSLNNDVNGRSFSKNVDRTGFGGELDINERPRIFKVPAGRILEMQGMLQPPQKKEEKKNQSQAGTAPAGNDSASVGSDTNASPTQEAGQDTLGAADSLRDTVSVNKLEQSFGENSAAAAQDAEDSFAISDGVTTIRQLLSIQVGRFNFTQSGVSFTGGGSYTIKFDVDIGARTVGGGNSKVFGSGLFFSPSSFQFDIPTTSIAGDSLDSKALGTIDNLPDVSGCCVGCKARIDLAALNSGGQAATHLMHRVTITNGSNSDSGSGRAQRSSGLS